MLIGILSDTHGRVEIALRAVTLLNQARVEFILHCGDIGDGVVELLPAGQSAFVFGNNDWNRDELRESANEHDVRCLEFGGVLELGGKRVAVCHGDRPRLIDEFLVAGVDYLFTGHTHIRHDQRVGKTRCVNPGALHRAAVKSVATLDLVTDSLNFHVISGP